MSGFRDALRITLRFEGGYADHADDPGGATNRGITQATYDAWRAEQGATPRPVREITDAEVTAIYRQRYWLDGRCNMLPWPVSAAHFDACVNHGLRNAARLLQRAVGVAADGIIGPITLGAVERSEPGGLVDEMLWQRLAFYERIMLRRRASRTFCLGWLSRVNALRRSLRDT